MTLLKTTAIALVIAAAPASAFACEWMSSETVSTATPVTIGSATVPNATPVDPDALSVPVIEVESLAEEAPDAEALDAE